MIVIGLKDAARAVSDFMAALEAQQGFGPDMAQRITIEAAPVIVAHVLSDWNSYGRN